MGQKCFDRAHVRIVCGPIKSCWQDRRLRDEGKAAIYDRNIPMSLGRCCTSIFAQMTLVDSFFNPIAFPRSRSLPALSGLSPTSPCDDFSPLKLAQPRHQCYLNKNSFNHRWVPWLIATVQGAPSSNPLKVSLQGFGAYGFAGCRDGRDSTGDGLPKLCWH